MQSPPPELEEPPPRRWQFSLAWMFWLTTAVAAVAMVVRVALDHPWIAVVLVGYAIVIGSYGVGRLLLDFVYTVDRERIRKYRHKLLAWAEARRDAKRHEEGTGENSSDSALPR